ncbi:hypothetical protein CVS40_2820 [Lucilia cuprina]|nr:hypothetical protein CVS40_2820 [Lucilia cuprina]
MVSRNAKKKQQNVGTTSSTSNNAASSSSSTTTNSSSSNKAVKKLDADLAHATQAQGITSSTSGEFHMAKHFKASSSSSKSAISETSVTEIQSNNESLSSSSKFSSKSQHHQEMSDEFSSMGKIISSVDLVSESAIKEPVFSVPIDVVEITTSGSTGSMKKVFSSITSSSQSTSQSMSQNMASVSSSSKAITDGSAGYIVDVEFKPETVIIKDESMATKQAFQTLAKSTNGATEMTSSSTMSSQFIAAESVNGKTTRAEQQSNTNTEKQHYTIPATQANTITSGSDNNVLLPADTYEVFMPPTPTPSTSSMTSNVYNNTINKSSRPHFDDFTAIDNNTSLTSIEQNKASSTNINTKNTSSTITSSSSTSQALRDTNISSTNSVNKKSLSTKQVSEKESLTQEQLSKKSTSKSKKEVYDVKTKTWSEFHEATNDTKQPTYERFVSQGSDGTCKVTYKKKIYDRRNNKWRIVEEKTVNNANEKVFPEIVDDVINTTTTTYTTKIYDSKLGEWKVVDEKSFVDSKAYVPQDIAREIEKDNTDVANITTTTEITKVREKTFA